MPSSEQLGTTRLATSGTSGYPSKHHHLTDGPPRPPQACALLGGGKRARSDEVWVDEEDDSIEHTSPGRLQNRLLVLQERAREAIQALPVECRDDWNYGQVETRVWGLEALKHVLCMRLAIQSNLMLCRPVEQQPEIPPSVELLAANLTLNIHNRGNRCYANSVLRMWCWMGAHHPRPDEFWGASTKLCMQILQQDEIPDIFWASELQPAIAQLENPQGQHDASEFLVLLWELWGQTGLQGDWHGHFGGRWHDFDTIPLFIRMPVELGEAVHFEQLLECWANEANGQCLGKDVEHIVFHIGRYYLSPQDKAWVKHHHSLHTPSTFKCPQRLENGQTGHSTFVLRGIIAHQGQELISGHYVTMLVEGEAVWVADDGKCPEVQKEVPEYIKRGAVMVWACRAEQNTFWSTAIGHFEPPQKRARHPNQEIQIMYANITQWTKDVKEWLIQQDHSVVMMVETHVHATKLEAAHNDLCRHRWQPTFMAAYETGRGGNSGGHLFCMREGQAGYRLHSFDHEGNGFLANVLQRQQWELVLISVYLKCGEDLNSRANSVILGELAAFIQQLAIPWVAIGDYQVPPEQWDGHNLLNVLRAEVVSSGQPTMVNGAEIDYLLACRSVAPFLEIKATWDVPWKPHAGLVVRVDKDAPRLLLPQLTQYASVPKLDDQDRAWEDFEPAPKPFWLGRPIGPKEIQYAEWCHQAEQFVLQRLNEPKMGRGWYLALENKPLPVSKPLTPWKKGDLAYWGQFSSLLQHIATKMSVGVGMLDHLRAKRTDLDVRWQEVHGLEDFKVGIDALIEGDPTPITLLIKGAECNKEFAKKLAIEQQSSDFQQWLAQAQLRGHSGIYRCLKAPDNVHVRPFRNVPVQQRQTLREQQWYSKWQVIDGPQQSAERERLRWEGIVQARSWEDLDPHAVMRKLQKLPQKACGPDGISYAMLKNLPIEGVIEMCHMMRKWELSGRLPDQVCTTLVLLLPKKADIERPISLTSVLYRTWCRLRWDKLRSWQTSIGQRLPWERSLPGTQVLQVALMRLLKCEVGRTAGRHVISLLIDLQCFYDSVDLAHLLHLWEPLDFPPAVMNMIYEVYGGPRLLQAEGITSSAVHCRKGMLAGCPAAPLVAKLVLAPVLKEFQAKYPKASADVWVDDISMDFVGDEAHSVCKEALAAYDDIRRGLEDIGLQLSATKTGFLTSTAEAKRAVNLYRTDEQPKAHDLLKDLGLDSSGGRRRRIGSQQQRMLKGRGRQAKLIHLKLRSRPIRIRVWKTSIHSAVSFGVEAQGVAPQRMRTLRQQLARHGGLQKKGSVDIVFDQHGHLQDPQDTAVERQLKAMHQLVRAWPPHQRGELMSAWRVSWRRLQAVAHPWIVVAGPMAALQVYLKDMGWDASVMDDWIRPPTGLMPANQLSLDFPWPYLQRQLHIEQKHQRARRIQELEHCFPLMRRPDWTVYHKVMKRLKGPARAAVDAWTQGTLRTHDSGERVLCPLCQIPVTMKHLVWQCSYHEEELPQDWQCSIQANEDTMLWARGLIEAPTFLPVEGPESCEVTGILARGWPVRLSPGHKLAIGVHATCQDIRIKKFAVALTVGTWHEGSWQIEGTCTALAPGQATEARSWVFGCWLLLQAVLGRHQLNIPNRAGWAALQKGGDSKVAPDLWHNLPAEEWPRLQLLHVPIQMMRRAEQDTKAWLQYVEAKLAAKSRAAKEAPNAWVNELKEADRKHQAIYEVAARRISAILGDKEHFMHGKLEKVEPVPEARPNKPKGRVELFNQLVQQTPVEGQHKWQHQRSGVVCEYCGKRIKACSTHSEISQKQATPCPGSVTKTLK